MTLATTARREACRLLLALQFLTRVPVPAGLPFAPAELARAVRYFPLVGAGVGAFGAAVALAAAALWPAPVAATLAVAATVWLTVAFHEDGLADTFDALLGAAPRDKALAIMKDSRIGTYGAAALVCTLLLRILLLAHLLASPLPGAPLAAAAALVAAHALGRTLAVVLMALLPYARNEGDGPDAQAKAGSVVRGARPADAVWALALGLPWVGAAAWLQPQPLAWAGAVGLAALAVVAVMRRWLQRRLGGCTGDALGATEQIGEIAVLLCCTATLR